MSKDKVVLECRDLKKSYTSGKDVIEVLKGVSLELHKGEIIAVVGPSGVGKSTLLHLLGAIDKPDDGRILVDGFDVLSLPEDKIAAFRNRHFGFVFQFHHLLPELSALENVMVPCIIAGMEMSRAMKRARRILEEDVGLAGRLHHRPRELSGGEQQRVAVARALVMNPVVVLADEPSGNLDPDNGRLLHDLIWDLREKLGQSYIIVTHNVELAQRCDRTLKLFDGVVEDVKI